MALRFLVMFSALCGALALAGCPMQPPPPAPIDPDLARAQLAAAQNPTGRWSAAHSRNWNNGTDVYTVDSATGTVCAMFISNDQVDKPERVGNQVTCIAPREQ